SAPRSSRSGQERLRAGSGFLEPRSPHGVPPVWTRGNPGAEQITGVPRQHRVASSRRERPDPFVAALEAPDAELRDECAVGRLVVPGDGYAIIERLQAGFV